MQTPIMSQGTDGANSASAAVGGVPPPSEPIKYIDRSRDPYVERDQHKAKNKQNHQQQRERSGSDGSSGEAERAGAAGCGSSSGAGRRSSAGSASSSGSNGNESSGACPAAASVGGGGGSSSSSSHFPSQLHLMLCRADVEGYASTVARWQPHGRCFIIHDRPAFVKDIMPLYFRQTKFSSFQRQLNLYGYIRMAKKGPDYGSYYHEHFLRSRPDLCRLMGRIKPQDTPVKQHRDEPDFYKMEPVGEPGSGIAGAGTGPLASAGGAGAAGYHSKQPRRQQRKLPQLAVRPPPSVNPPLAQQQDRQEQQGHRRYQGCSSSTPMYADIQPTPLPPSSGTVTEANATAMRRQIFQKVGAGLEVMFGDIFPPPAPGQQQQGSSNAVVSSSGSSGPREFQQGALQQSAMPTSQYSSFGTTPATMISTDSLQQHQPQQAMQSYSYQHPQALQQQMVEPSVISLLSSFHVAPGRATLPQQPTPYPDAHPGMILDFPQGSTDQVGSPAAGPIHMQANAPAPAPAPRDGAAERIAPPAAPPVSLRGPSGVEPRPLRPSSLSSSSTQHQHEQDKIKQAPDHHHFKPLPHQGVSLSKAVAANQGQKVKRRWLKCPGGDSSSLSAASALAASSSAVPKIDRKPTPRNEESPAFGAGFRDVATMAAFLNDVDLESSDDEDCGSWADAELGGYGDPGGGGSGDPGGGRE